MLISVIIPHHKETLNFMTPLLSTLDTQIGIDYNDVEFIIVNDDKESIIEDFSKFGNLAPRIKNLFNEKAGYMGVSRQIGIDNAKGDYLLFFDADDLCYSCTILFDLMSRCVKKDADIYSYKFIEELKYKDNVTSFLIHNSNFVWVFAKLYSKDFLRRHNIRFSDNLLYHEDTFFNQVILAYNPRIKELDYVGYVWRYNPNSITRKNNAEYTSKSICMYIDSISEVIERTKYVLTSDLITDKKIWLIAYIYASLQELVQIELRSQFACDIEKRLSAFIKKYDPDFDCIKIEYSQIVSDTLHANKNIVVPKEGFIDFVKRIVKEF